MRFLISLILAFGMAGVALAQDAKQPADPAKGLQYFVGKWDATVQFKLPDGTEHEGKTSCDTKTILDGKFIQQEYKSTLGGQPLTVLQFVGYDMVKKKFVEFDIHAEGPQTSTMHSEGSFSPEGKVLTLAGDEIYVQTGKTVHMRTVTTIVDNDHYTLEWFMTEPGGKEERKVVLKHVRKK